MSANATVPVKTHEILVAIDGMPHLLLRRSAILGIQSQIRTVSAAEPIHFIEFTTTSGEIFCDYDDRTLWEKILTGLVDARLFDERIGE